MIRVAQVQLVNRIHVEINSSLILTNVIGQGKISSHKTYMFRLFLSQIKELEDLHKQVDGLKYSVHASSILDVDDMADHVQTLSLKNKVSLPAEKRGKHMCGLMVTKTLKKITV